MRRFRERVVTCFAALACLAAGATARGQETPGTQPIAVTNTGLPTTLAQDGVAVQQDPSKTPPPTPPMTQEAKDKELQELRKVLKDAQEKLDKLAPAEPAPAHNPYAPDKAPFSIEGDMSWAPAGYAPSKSQLNWGIFTGEVRVDTALHMDLNRPKDHTISGSSEEFRSDELSITQVGFGGDFYYEGVQARIMTQFGLYSTANPRNDPSPGRGQWQLDNAYRYLSEAYGGYHLNVLDGINFQAGLFMSYVGLWSYYNFDNWTYQPSYVSSNTPWFFNGMRIQFFPNDKLKIEPWIVNGWQSYGKFNEAPG